MHFLLQFARFLNAHWLERRLVLFSLSSWLKLWLSPGKPVAVTSNRGAGRVPHRAGVNFQLEQQYYEKKLGNPRPGEAVAPVTTLRHSSVS